MKIFLRSSSKLALHFRVRHQFKSSMDVYIPDLSNTLIFFWSINSILLLRYAQYFNSTDNPTCTPNAELLFMIMQNNNKFHSKMTNIWSFFPLPSTLFGKRKISFPKKKKINLSLFISPSITLYTLCYLFIINFHNIPYVIIYPARYFFDFRNFFLFSSLRIYFCLLLSSNSNI